jgi:hypothetical protein
LRKEWSVRFLRRLEGSHGQGVFEIVLILSLIAAMAAAVPAYLQLQAQRADKSAKANLVAAARAAQSYLWTNGSYAKLNNIDLVRETPDADSTSVVWAHRRSYCIASTVRGKTWSLQGPYKSAPKFRPSDDCS